MLRRVAQLLVESDSETLQDVGEYVVDVLDGRR